LGRTSTGWIAPAFGWRTYSFTYIKDGNDWKIVDHHSSAVPAPPK
jgi:hypothetical protein